MDKFQVVSWVNYRAYFTGTSDECHQWLADYGSGWAQFDILPFDREREMGDIIETY